MKQPKKIVINKIKRTKTMEATIKEGSEYLSYTKSYFHSSLRKTKTPQSIKPIPKSAIIKKSPKKITKKTAIPTKAENVSIKTPIIRTTTPQLIQNNSSLPSFTNDEIKTILTKKTSSRIGLPGGPVAGMIDIVFCCDTTFSMNSYLQKTKEVIQKIIEKIHNKVNKEMIDLKFGFVAYRDHPPQETTYVIKTQNLCDEVEILDFISKQDAYGGGDLPEAVMDGLWEAANNISWRNACGTPILRYIIHIADAPPHGIIYEKDNDFFVSPWKNGCPCGITIEKIAHVINMREIHYRLVKAGNQVEKMAEVFKKHIIDYQEMSLDNATMLDIKVSDMVIRELLPDDPNALMI